MSVVKPQLIFVMDVNTLVAGAVLAILARNPLVFVAWVGLHLFLGSPPESPPCWDLTY